jgi:hypothetical protein
MPLDDQTVDQIDAPEDDLHALLNKAFTEHEEPAEPVEKPEKPAAKPRAPDGKFAKSDDDKAVDDPPEPLEKPETKPVDDKPEKPATAEPPNLWKAEDKETFKALPPEAQQFLLRRHGEMEADYTRKTQQHAAFVRDYDPVRQVLSPYEAQIKQAGFTPATLVKAWSDVEKGLMEGRGVDIVRDLVTNYRLDKAQLARVLGLTGAAGSGGAGTEAPPAPQAQQPIVLPPELARELETLRNGHQQVTQFLTSQQQAQQREAENRVNNTIEAFRGAKDPSGALLHPHWDELETDMVDLWKIAAAAGQQPTLEDVYDKAVWANTSTRQKLLDAQTAASEAQRATAEKQRQTEARAKAERARKASSSVTGAPGSGQARVTQAQAEGGSLRDQLNSAFDDLAE